MSWIRSHRVASASIAAVIFLVAIGAVAIGYFEVHRLFIDDKVNEAAPVFASGATTPTEPGSDTTVAGAETPPSTEPAPPDAPPVETVAEGTFISRSHPAEGTAVVLSDGSQTFVRFEEFKTDNGPDLFVYLSKGVTADSPEGDFDTEFIDLGGLKGNIGPQNYEIPAGTDLSEYDTVVVWCREFTVAFGAADLVATA